MGVEECNVLVCMFRLVVCFLYALCSVFVCIYRGRGGSLVLLPNWAGGSLSFVQRL